MRLENNLKVLIVDPICESGHKNFNRYFLKLFAQISDVTFLTRRGYLELNSPNIKQIYFSKEGNGKSVIPHKVNYRIQQLKFVREALRIYNDLNFSNLVFLSYETLSVSIVIRNVNNVKVFEHNNIDQLLNSRIKSIAYNLISNKIKHLVFEKYIGDFLYNNYSKNYIVIPHPYYDDYLVSECKLGKCIFAPSSTYEEKVQMRLINYCENNNLNLVIKGEKRCISGCVIIDNFFEDYKDILKTCLCVFITNEFNYRVSGVVYEALSCYKIVIGFESRFLKELKRLYPKLVCIVRNESDFVKLVGQIRNNKLVEKDWNAFKSTHSMGAIKTKLVELLKDS